MRILITGAFGYLGGRISSFFSSIPDHEIILASSRNVKTSYLPKHIKFIQINWEDEQSILNACSNIDIIIHTSGMNAHECSSKPVEALIVNGVYTAKLVKSAISNNVKKIIYFSTAHVYDKPLKGIITENVCPKNKHPYSTSHLAGEDVVIQSHLSGKIQGIVLRLSNCIGAPTDLNSNCWMLLVNDLCKQVIEQKKMKLNTNGEQLRNFITIIDVCRVLRSITELNFKVDDNIIFNIGNKTMTIIKMAQIIQKRSKLVLGFSPKIEVLDQENIEHENFHYMTYRLDAIGFRNFTNYEKEIDDLLIFCKNHFSFE